MAKLRRQTRRLTTSRVLLLGLVLTVVALGALNMAPGVHADLAHTTAAASLRRETEVAPGARHGSGSRSRTIEHTFGADTAAAAAAVAASQQVGSQQAAQAAAARPHRHDLNPRHTAQADNQAAQGAVVTVDAAHKAAAAGATNPHLQDRTAAALAAAKAAQQARERGGDAAARNAAAAAAVEAEQARQAAEAEAAMKAAEDEEAAARDAEGQGVAAEGEQEEEGEEATAEEGLAAEAEAEEFGDTAEADAEGGQEQQGVEGGAGAEEEEGEALATQVNVGEDEALEVRVDDGEEEQQPDGTEQPEERPEEEEQQEEQAGSEDTGTAASKAGSTAGNAATAAASAKAASGAAQGKAAPVAGKAVAAAGKVAAQRAGAQAKIAAGATASASKAGSGAGAGAVAGAGASLAQGTDRYHLIISLGDGVYTQWQSRVCYYWYMKTKAECEAKQGGKCPMGGFTRLLHSGNPDGYETEVPTVVVDPLPPKWAAIADGYVVLERPYAFQQWVRKHAASIPERYIIMGEPDQLWLRPPPLWATPVRPAAFPFFYIEPRRFQGIVDRYNPTKVPIDAFPPIGNSPVMIAKDQFASIVDRWVNLSIALKQDPEADKEWGWVQEMYAYSMASAMAPGGPIEYELHVEFQLQPPWDDKLTAQNGKDACFIHYTYGNDFDAGGKFTPGKVGVWHWDKRDWTDKYPPRNFPMPPAGCTNVAVKELVTRVNEAAAALDDWDEHTGDAAQQRRRRRRALGGDERPRWQAAEASPPSRPCPQPDCSGWLQ